jgi:ADP-ribose pyrophosphatase YjhB (NUDIX family)
MRDAFCSFCGHAHENTKTYPRACPSCKTTIWANPIPVSIVLVPIVHESKQGLLVVRRGIEPGRGKLALVGGFLEEHETWAEGGAREVREETGVIVDESTLTPLWFTSTDPRPNRVLLFSTSSALDSAKLPRFVPNTEALERGVIFGVGGLAAQFAFPLHLRAATRFFEERGIAGDHAFVSV